MIYFKYLFHNLKDLSPNEGIVFSELLFHSLVSNPDYKSGEVFNIELAKDEMSRYKELQWVEDVRYYSMDYSKIMQHTEMSFPTVKKILKSLHNKNLINAYHIICPYDLLNEGYIKIGTKKQLTELGIVSGGFLKKTKVNYDAIKKGAFMRVDIRQFTEMTIESGDPKILTQMPKTSYKIIKNGKTSTLYVIDPTAFWSISNFLIIQTK